MNDRRGLTFGIILLALGTWFLLRQQLHLSGPGPILLLLGAIFFAISATRGFRGPFAAGCILLGLGTVAIPTGADGTRAADARAARPPIRGAHHRRPVAVFSSVGPMAYHCLWRN